MYAQRVGQLKGRVALDTITAVEFVEESAFNLPHTFQVSHDASLCQWCVNYITIINAIYVSCASRVVMCECGVVGL